MSDLVRPDCYRGPKPTWAEMERTCEKCPYLQECMDVWMVGGDWCFRCDKQRRVRLEGTHTWVCGNPRCSEYMKVPDMVSTHDYARMSEDTTVCQEKVR